MRQSTHSSYLGPLNERDSKTATATVDGVGVFLSLDSQKKCRGVYMVGPSVPEHVSSMPNGEATVRLLVVSVPLGTPVSRQGPGRQRCRRHAGRKVRRRCWHGGRTGSSLS